jgi:hypothetical protein
MALWQDNMTYVLIGFELAIGVALAVLVLWLAFIFIAALLEQHRKNKHYDNLVGRSRKPSDGTRNGWRSGREFFQSRGATAEGAQETAAHAGPTNSRPSDTGDRSVSSRPKSRTFEQGVGPPALEGVPGEQNIGDRSPRWKA